MCNESATAVIGGAYPANVCYLGFEASVNSINFEKENKRLCFFSQGARHARLRIKYVILFIIRPLCEEYIGRVVFRFTHLRMDTVIWELVRATERKRSSVKCD